MSAEHNTKNSPNKNITKSTKNIAKNSTENSTENRMLLLCTCFILIIFLVYYSYLETIGSNIPLAYPLELISVLLGVCAIYSIFKELKT
jgi:hypothetical protein